MTWRERIEGERKRLIGKNVIFEGKIHKITDVDYNGCVLIDKPARFTPDTAAYSIEEVDKHIVDV